VTPPLCAHGGARPCFERLAVVGLGVLGGSVALAAQARGIAAEICGVDPVLEGATPFRRSTLREAAAWADGIVLAVPVDAVEDVIRDLAPHVQPGTLVTDTASVKEPVAMAARRWLRHPENCVGAHPMAGSEKSGFAHASAELFEGAPCILALCGNEPPSVVDRVEQFWQGLGSVTVRKTPEEHDAIVAVLSHVPHLIAYAFAQGLPDGETLRLAGPGLRDFTRIARSNPSLWGEILLMNRAQVAEEAARFRTNLDRIITALGRGDRGALVAALQAGQSAIEKL
jgi:prephenate dehydrogenase